MNTLFSLLRPSTVIGLIFLFFLSTNLNAKVISSRDIGPQAFENLDDESKIIVSAIWDELGHKSQIEDVVKPAQKEDLQIDSSKQKSNQQSKSAVVAPQKELMVKPKPKEKKLSRGQMLIEKQKAAARAKIKSIRAGQKAQDAIEAERKSNPRSQKQIYLDNLAKLKKQNRDTVAGWRAKTQETYKRWREKRAEFLKQIKSVQETHFNFSTPPLNISSQKLARKISKVPNDKVHLIPGALDISVRNQKRRPTCAAFAGVRAIEILLNASGNKMDLSEQYFYWSSKPKCRRYPCQRRGSWVVPGFDFSANSNRLDIPREKDCPYVESNRQGNESQTPLSGGCQKGVVKTLTHRQLPYMDDIVNALKNNSPVIAGVKLTPNFYKNEGMVKIKNAYVGPSMDSHAAGHAIIFVGFMHLPKSEHASEGRLCFITANSWGEGWGKGGHACLSEKWVLKQRMPSAVVALDKIQI